MSNATATRRSSEGAIAEISEIQEVVVVGAGPAGLTAATYLGRFRRRCIVLEDDHSRARWIPTSHNIPGFAAGVGGSDLLHSLKIQALKYGALFRRARAASLTVNGDLFVLGTDAGAVYCRYILLATGVRDHMPAVAGAHEALARSLLRVCPICDAYEAIDKRIGVLSNGQLGEREAKFLKRYSSRVTLLDVGPPVNADIAQTAGIEHLSIQLADLRIREDRVTLASPSGQRDFDVVYLALGCTAQHDLARSLNAECDEHGALRVNPHQQTSIPRLYAAGDVVRGLHQVVVAAAEGALAATDIHNKLRGA